MRASDGPCLRRSAAKATEGACCPGGWPYSARVRICVDYRGTDEACQCACACAAGRTRVTPASGSVCPVQLMCGTPARRLCASLTAAASGMRGSRGCKHACVLYQRGLSEAQNGYGFDMIPGYGPPDGALSSSA